MIIHFGLHKTGTTAVQEYLRSNKAALLQRGASYIPLARMREEVTGLFHKTNDQKRDAARRLFQSFPTHSLILSDENIAGGVSDIAAGAFYPMARDKVTSVLEALSDLDVHLVLTLRNPAELVPALYSEYVRHFDFVNFDTYVAKIDLPGISHWHTFGWLRTLPGNVTTHIIPYETRLGGGVPQVAATIVRAAAGTPLGFDFRHLYENKVRTSFMAEELELAALVANKSSGRVARLFLNTIDKDARFGERRFLPLQEATAVSLTQRYEEDLARFDVAAA